MLVTIIVFLVVLSIIVFVHEVGHFYTARKLGIGVEEFGFGYPPRMFGIKRKRMIYSINWIPLGGFVKIKGESGDHAEDQDSFMNQPAWKRALVLFAGVFMNWFFAFVLLTIGFIIGLPGAVDSSTDTAGGGAIISNRRVQIIEVYENSPAGRENLEIEDIIQSVNNLEFENADQMRDYLVANQDSELSFNIRRGKQDIKINLTPEEIPELAQEFEEYKDKKIVGINLIDSGIISYPWYRAPWEGLKTTVNVTYRILDALYKIIKGGFTGEKIIEISGPVGVAIFSGRAYQMGFVYLLWFMALLSINLAIINILPIPALDGGRLLFLLIEKIRKKPINQKLEATIHNIGFILLMLLVVLITYKDIVRYGGGLISKIGGLF